MSLQPRTAFQIPEETQRVARAAFPQSTLCLRIADALGPVYGDEQFADLFPRRGQPAVGLLITAYPIGSPGAPLLEGERHTSG